MPALLQVFARLVALKRLGVLLFVLAATLYASSTASAIEAAQTKTRVRGFDFVEHNNSAGLLRAVTSGKHQGNRLALSEVASGSLLAAEGVEGGLSLASHELAGGHTLALHVGLDNAALDARLAAQGNLSLASSFATQAEAEAAGSAVLGQNAGAVSSWAQSGAAGRLVVNGNFSGGAIRVLGGYSAEATGARFVLQGNGAGGFFILTGFPVP